MNAVEVEEAITALAERAFEAKEFPYQFLEAFGNKETTLKRLRAGVTNRSDVGGLLQTNNIHIAVAQPGEVGKTLSALRASPATIKAKAKFILATDGETFEAEDLESGETVACPYADFPNHFGFFLTLAGITTVKQVRDSSFDIRATSRLNRLYVQLLKENPEWGTLERRHDMNHFMARLIFCFFAENTDIFSVAALFTSIVEQMSAKDGSNTHEVIGELFRAMNTKPTVRTAAGIPRWADPLPYVNGGLFSGGSEAPTFSKIALSYFRHIGSLPWTKINPDIFGSMIQAVADDEERGALGMHYTSTPNILKVLDPLFLDDLRATLAEAGDNARKLLNLRNRMARVRVFDPACGSGNFLVIAYKRMREIEAEINRRRGERARPSDIPLTNFRGIELRDFPAEIARLALIIAEFQCDEEYRGKQLALAEFLPLSSENWITCGNALRLDWMSICPPTGTGVKFHADDLFHTPLDQAQIDFENEGGETYICGNPPYLGSKWQKDEHKADLNAIFANRSSNWKSLDYVAGWFMKAADYGMRTNTVTAFVATNSICQGQQVPFLWPLIFQTGHEIAFAHTSFKWANLASRNAGVTVVIVGISNHAEAGRHLASLTDDGTVIVKEVENINPYLIPGSSTIIVPTSKSISDLPEMTRGNSPTDGGYLILEFDDIAKLHLQEEDSAEFIRPFVGSKELISGTRRFCIWIEDDAVERALKIPQIRERVEHVREFRLESQKAATVKATNWPHRFDERKPIPIYPVICVPVISSESRPYLPADVLPGGTVVSNKAFTLSGKELWPLAIICTRMNIAWVATVCARMRTDFSYTNTLGWNTLPVPALTDKNKDDLTRCAEDILLARESHFPASIADLYDPDAMPTDLRAAHERNDEVLERIYIGRRFRNDTERLEKLFELYTKMLARVGATKKPMTRASA